MGLEKPPALEKIDRRCITLDTVCPNALADICVSTGDNMKRLLEDWELDRLADGEGTPEMQRTLAESPTDQQRFQEIRQEEQRLRQTLFRADCPSTLALGEWQFGMVVPEQTVILQSHIAACPHCTAELVQIQSAMNAPVTDSPKREPVLRRLIMKLESLLDDIAGTTAASPVALRGETWSGLYTSGDYMISLTKRRVSSGYLLQGSVIMPEPMAKGQAQLTLKQNETVIVKSPLSAAATFTFNKIQPGRYELIVTTSSSELVVPELQF